MRHVVRHTVEREGRDKGKVFIITELSPIRAEKWAFRALSALAKSGVELPGDVEDIKRMGMAAIAALGFQALAGVNPAEAEPLLDEMLECVEIAPDLRNPQVKRPLAEGDIEEIATLLQLRKAVFEVHTGFFGAASGSKSTSETE